MNAPPGSGAATHGAPFTARDARMLQGAESYHAERAPRGLDRNFTITRSSARRALPKTWGMTRVQTRPDLPFTEVARSRPTVRPHTTWTAWACALFTAGALGYGLWMHYGTGTRIVMLPLFQRVPGAAVPQTDADFGPISIPFGPIGLSSEMNPLRATLRATCIRIGEARIHYRIAIVDDGDQPVLETEGALDGPERHGTTLKTTTNLGEFRLQRACAYFVRLQATGRSMDDLRAATLELRRNVVPADGRIPWAAGACALACLIGNRIAARDRSRPAAPDRETSRDEERKAA
jgi:hypothetical protein